ncbi:hypothetical protein EYC84_007611 [Monilinia fructicola]|uniref:Uncharacterized protein n=1 Tax=Monilinia fructicola TaxID=38448 RepID=A0A5M9JNK0_MONFR|nr:hypothetical protein EYC84_007611 [Monilinia fructicola]
MPIFSRTRPIERIMRRRGRLRFEDDISVFEEIGICDLFDIFYQPCGSWKKIFTVHMSWVHRGWRCLYRGKNHDTRAT